MSQAEFALFAIAAILSSLWWHDRRSFPPGVEAAVPRHAPPVTAAPVQLKLASPKTFHLKGYTLSAPYSYAVTARVLGAERYYFDRKSELSPVDLALGWGPMADRKVLRRIPVTQDERFYFWRAKPYPIPRRHIESYSSNTHVIPANSAVDRQIKELDSGDLVTLGGYLVNVSHPDGFAWSSSVSRDDVNAGACEVFYVQYVEESATASSQP